MIYLFVNTSKEKVFSLTSDEINVGGVLNAAY